MAKRAYIKHITSYYPNNFEFNNPENRITSKIGVSRRPIALPNECASDLAVEAAKIMFEKYNVNIVTNLPETIEANNEKIIDYVNHLNDYNYPQEKIHVSVDENN